MPWVLLSTATAVSTAVSPQVKTIKSGATQLRSAQSTNVSLQAGLRDAEAKASRADTLLPKLEERRWVISQEA